MQFAETISIFFSPHPCIDVNVSSFTPMNNETYACTEGLDDGSGPCSCQDCSAACGPQPVPPPLPPPWTILGMDAMIVIMWISYSVFLLIFVVGVLGAWYRRCRRNLTLNPPTLLVTLFLKCWVSLCFSVYSGGGTPLLNSAASLNKVTSLRFISQLWPCHDSASSQLEVAPARNLVMQLDSDSGHYNTCYQVRRISMMEALQRGK